MNSNQTKKICIITTRHISYNPRVMKEADALHARGYNVTVITICNNQLQSEFDAELMRNRRWKLKTINFRRTVKAEHQRWLRFSLVKKFYDLVLKVTPKFGIAEAASLKGYHALRSMAMKEQADYYIAHHAEALSIAYYASKKHGKQFGFDAEDFHTGMTDSNDFNTGLLISYLEAKYLPFASTITAASKGIADAYCNRYNAVKPTVVLNVFPLEDVQAGLNNIPRFYWYSQVIGPNRSLETLLEAASQLNAPFELYIRGSFHSASYEEHLKSIAANLHISGKVRFLPPINASQIIPDGARYDVGLALESNVSINRDICVTNKIFSYLMSGLAIIATDTTGQVDISKDLGKAMLICRQNDSEDLARAMSEYIQNPSLLTNARENARALAEERFNWDNEAELLFQNINNVLIGQEKSTLQLIGD